MSFCSLGGRGLDTEPPPGWADPPLDADTPPGLGRPPTRYGQQAGDIHPTGMHTCSPVRFHYNLQICILYHTSYCYFYRPQRSWGKVMFLQASVILLTGVGCLPQCMLGYTPPEQTPPRSRHTPQSRHAPLEQTPPGVNTPPPRTRYTPRD